MKNLSLWMVMVALVVGLVSVAAAAGETTLSGNMMCAKCTLKAEGATQCQNVLVVKDDNGKATQYYVAKNEVSEQFGHVCKGDKPAVVTGQVEEKDGKLWITPSKMEEKK
jgi:hypothetical protein